MRRNSPPHKNNHRPARPTFAGRFYFCIGAFPRALHPREHPRSTAEFPCASPPPPRGSSSRLGRRLLQLFNPFQFSPAVKSCIPAAPRVENTYSPRHIPVLHVQFLLCIPNPRNSPEKIKRIAVKTTASSPHREPMMSRPCVVGVPRGRSVLAVPPAARRLQCRSTDQVGSYSGSQTRPVRAPPLPR